MRESCRTDVHIRRVLAAVDAVCDAAASSEAVSLLTVVQTVARERGRPIEIDLETPLATGVCGQRRAYDDHDVIVLAPGLSQCRANSGT